jgi:hypothetical protein
MAPPCSTRGDGELKSKYRVEEKGLLHLGAPPTAQSIVASKGLSEPPSRSRHNGSSAKSAAGRRWRLEGGPTKHETGTLRLLQSGGVVADGSSLMVEILGDNAQPVAGEARAFAKESQARGDLRRRPGQQAPGCGAHHDGAQQLERDERRAAKARTVRERRLLEQRMKKARGT